MQTALQHVKALSYKLQQKSDECALLEEEIDDRERTIQELAKKMDELRATVEILTDRCEALQVEATLAHSQAETAKQQVRTLANTLASESQKAPRVGLANPFVSDNGPTRTSWEAATGTLQSIRPMMDMVSALEHIHVDPVVVPTMPTIGMVCALAPDATPLLSEIREAYLDDQRQAEDAAWNFRVQHVLPKSAPVTVSSLKQSRRSSSEKQDVNAIQESSAEAFSGRFNDLEEHAQSLVSGCQGHPSMNNFLRRIVEIEKKNASLREKLQTIGKQAEDNQVLVQAFGSSANFWQRQAEEALQNKQQLSQKPHTLSLASVAKLHGDEDLSSAPTSGPKKLPLKMPVPRLGDADEHSPAPTTGPKKLPLKMPVPRLGDADEHSPAPTTGPKKLPLKMPVPRLGDADEHSPAPTTGPKKLPLKMPVPRLGDADEHSPAPTTGPKKLPLKMPVPRLGDADEHSPAPTTGPKKLPLKMPVPRLGDADEHSPAPTTGPKKLPLKMPLVRE